MISSRITGPAPEAARASSSSRRRRSISLVSSRAIRSPASARRSSPAWRGWRRRSSRTARASSSSFSTGGGSGSQARPGHLRSRPRPCLACASMSSRGSSRPTRSPGSWRATAGLLQTRPLRAWTESRFPARTTTSSPQFFTPELNRREDEWAEPSRFLLAVLAAVRAAAPALTVGVRLSADSEAARAVAAEIASHVDYIGLALGDSTTYVGSTGIVPPPPVPENAIAALIAPFQVGPPLLATSRIVDPVEADRLIGEGRCDAVGMTRALITDPDMPRKAQAGKSDAVVRCIGCNACIAHYHAGTPIACAQNPRTGRERTLPPPEPSADPRRIVVVGAGPAGLAAAAEAAAAGHNVVLLERSRRIGGQVALAGAAPMHEEVARSLRANYERLLDRVDIRLETEGDEGAISALAPAAVIVATGARPYEPTVALAGLETVQAWDILAGPRPRGRRVIVADWGGDATGLAAADLLNRDGNEVIVAIGSVALGETLHQYQRNVYAARLYRAGVRLEHHLELAGAEDSHVRL